MAKRDRYSFKEARRTRLPQGSLREHMQRLEAHVICEALRLEDGNVRAAAERLDMQERTLWRRIESYGINVDSYRQKG